MLLKGARDEHRVPVTDDFWPLYHRYFREERHVDPSVSALWVGLRKGKEHPLTYASFESSLPSVAWSPDGKRLASATEEIVHVWDPITGKTLFNYRDHSQPVTSVAWSPEGERLASASRDETVRVWLML